MRLVNLTGRPVHINTAVRGALWIAPLEADEWYGVPTTERVERPVSIENGLWDGTPDAPVTVRVRRENLFVNTSRPLPAPVEGIGYIVQANVMTMHPEREDLYMVAGGDLWQETSIVRTTDEHERAALHAIAKEMRATTTALIREEALAYIDSREEGAEGLTIQLDSVTYQDILSRQRT